MDEDYFGSYTSDDVFNKCNLSKIFFKYSERRIRLQSLLVEAFTVKRVFFYFELLRYQKGQRNSWRVYASYLCILFSKSIKFQAALRSINFSEAKKRSWLAIKFDFTFCIARGVGHLKEVF